MAVSPITISRVSHNMQTQLLIKGMRHTMVDLLGKQEQLATGLRLLRPSDNPIDTTAAMRLEDLLEAQEQYLTNMNHATKLMNLADATVGSVYDLGVEARDLVLENIGSTASSDQRKAAATLVESIINQLVTLGNTEYLGTFLFAGAKSNAPPFTLADNLVSFSGDQSQTAVQVSSEICEPTNLTAAQVFGSGSGVVRSDHDLEPAASTTIRLGDLAGALGQGIRTGTLVIRGSVIGQREIDVTGSATVADIIDKVNAALPVSVRMSLSADGRSLQLISSNPGETLQVLETGQGTIAHDLGLYTPTPVVGTIVGQDVGNKLVLQTPVTALNRNGGLDLASGIIISNGATSITVDFSSAETVQDILNTIRAAGVGLDARITDDGTGIEIINTLAGAELRIAENGGTTAADLGIRTFTGDTLLSSLNGGLGVNTVDGDDMRIITSDDSVIDVDISGAVTIQDVISRINAAAAAAGAALTASIAATGNGIVLTDSTGGANTLRVQRLNLSNAAEDLSLLGEAPAGSNQIIGQDVNPVNEQSLFTFLIDLKNALNADDTRGIELAGGKIENYLDELNRYRGKLGFMARALETRRDRTEDAVLSTQTLLSEIKDLDFTEAITEFEKLQATMQANLMAGARILDTSLLDFLQ